MYDLPYTNPPLAQRLSTVSTRPAPLRAMSPQVLVRMLDVVAHGLLLVLEDGHIVFANQVARSEMDDRHPLQLLGDAVRVRRSQDVGALASAIEAACSKGLQKLVRLGDGGTDTVVLSVIPMHHSGYEGDPCALLVFGKRNVCDELTTDAFARQHQLTAAEVRVLKQLCHGQRPSDIAKAQGVALCTIRSQIGGAREKTGAQSIGALVRLVTHLPPLQSVVCA